MAAETPSPPSPPSPTPLPHHNQYWCHHCEKRVSTETLPDQPDIICSECKFGFVESISAVTTTTANTFTASFPSPPRIVTPDISGIDEPTLSSQFLNVLRLLAQVARDDHPAPPPPPPPPRASESPSDDFLRIEFDYPPLNNINSNNHISDNDDDDEEDENEEEDDDEDVRSVEIEGESDDDDDENNEDGVVDDVNDDEEERRRRRRDVLRLRLRDFAARASSGGRNRILDWAEILMGLEDNSIEFRFDVPTEDRYVSDPGDYVDAAEYDALLQNLADAEGRRGAPPANKAAIDALKEVVIKVDNRVGYEEGSYVCAICKDGVNVGDVVKEMPCGHGYHGDCIVPWLAARNSCPVCRFELPTDDLDYEEEKRKWSSGGGGGGSGSGGGFGESESSSVASVDF